MMIGPSAPERASGSDRNRGGHRLEQGHLRLDATAADENRLDRFGNAVAADALRAVARHDADRERARDRHEDDERPEMVTGRRDERRVEALKEEEIREQPDQLEQRRRDVRGKDANQNREARQSERCGSWS